MTSPSGAPRGQTSPWARCYAGRSLPEYDLIGDKKISGIAGVTLHVAIGINLIEISDIGAVVGWAGTCARLFVSGAALARAEEKPVSIMIQQYVYTCAFYSLLKIRFIILSVED